MKKLVILGPVVLLAVGVSWFWRTRQETRRQTAVLSACRLEPLSRLDVKPTRARMTADKPADGIVATETAQTEDSPGCEPDENELLVNVFDDLTDKWMAPSQKGVTMADVDNFVKSFRKVPKVRQNECIHRALNLIPDENVMLLAGVLMDKTADREVVETVYNDILNRDEDVKKPILQEIFKDKTHPCWADTAWILDVTGELPQAK